eukprot:5860144-Amphidinium_carterae.2
MGFQEKPGKGKQDLRVEIDLVEVSRSSLFRLLSLSLSIFDAMVEHNTAVDTAAVTKGSSFNTASAVVREGAKKMALQ